MTGCVIACFTFLTYLSQTEHMRECLDPARTDANKIPKCPASNMLFLNFENENSEANTNYTKTSKMLHSTLRDVQNKMKLGKRAGEGFLRRVTMKLIPGPTGNFQSAEQKSR